MFGEPVLRSEDPRFLRGQARYLENLEIAGALRAVFVRSMMPHARVSGVDVAAAGAVPGVVAVYVADDLRIPPMPPSGMVEGAVGHLETPFLREVLARDRVRFVGDLLALVVAEDLATAEDAAELVVADLEALPAVNDVALAASSEAPLLFPEVGTNVAHSFSSSWDVDVLAGSEVVARGTFVNQRLAPVPMEGNGIAVVPEGDDRYSVWVSTQVPFDVRADLADLLGVERSAVRTIAPDVGGGFGAKLQIYPEYLAVARAAQLLGRPVRWSEGRSESMLALTHGRAQIQDVEIGARRDGTLVGMRVELLADMGAYPIGAFLPTTTQEMLSGVYAFPAIASCGRSVVTNGTPVAPYRGAGRPEATALVERAMDLLATELEMDPVELRRRNLIPPEAFPYRTVTGATYDVGAYDAALDEALRLGGYEALRAEQTQRRARGDHLALGIGVCCYVEITSFSSKEWASVEVGEGGVVTVLTGTSPHGQGHETAFAQIASATLGVAFEDVRVIHSDSGVVRSGNGTWGSRSLQAGGSAVYEQSVAVAERARALAAERLEVDPRDLGPFLDGGIGVRGAPERRVTWAELAQGTGGLADPDDAPLRAEGRYRQPGSTFPFGAHLAVVEVDTETGDVRLVRHIAVDDCGRVLNPALVEGQVHGGLAQGIAQALYEVVTYDEVGNPTTANLSTYAIPSAAELPWFETVRTQTPTPRNPLGVKGIGESACIGSTPAVQNAAVDALAHLGVRHLDLPLSPERVVAAIRATRPPTPARPDARSTSG
jgi:aerobic carbon-monoxide dehydrogenase large subunit